MGKQEIIFDKVEDKEPYRSDNARKVNSVKNPDGYLYVLYNERFDLIKVGVSSSPKRRINDIKSGLPFQVECVFLRRFLDVYSIEELVHNKLHLNKVKGEWFQIYNSDLKELIKILKQVS